MQPFFLLILFINFMVFLNSAKAEVATPENAQINRLVELGLSENCAYEPIFRGKACVYEINKKAKETVVLVHGLNSQAESWAAQVAVLKDDYHVVSFDLPGFGKSTRGNKLYSPTNYARFIHYITQKTVGSSFYLVGHSMGGAISLRYNEMYPNDVKRLVLADVGGVLHQYAFAKSIAFKWLKVLQGLAIWAIPGLQDMPSMDEMANALFQRLEWLPIDIRDALRVPELRTIILNGNSIPIAGAAVSSENLNAAIRSNKTPTLIIWGAYDLVTPIRSGNILETKMQNAYLKILSRSAHSPMTDQPVEFNKLMLAHLRAPESELRNKVWTFPQFKQSNRVGYCSKGEEKLFEGSYFRIELHDCKRAVIRHASVGSIVAKSSDIEIENSQIMTNDIGIILFDSTLEMTSSNVAATIGIQTVRSHVDVAGVDFKVGTVAVNNLGQSDAVFSVSTVNGAGLHTYKDFTLEGRL